MGRGGCCGLGRRWGPRRSGRLRPRSGAPVSGVDRRPDRVHEDGRPLSARVLLADASGHGRALLDRERFLRTPDRGCCARRRRVGCCTSTGGPAMLARADAGGGSRRTRGWIAGARGPTPWHDGWERRPVGPGALGFAGLRPGPLSHSPPTASRRPGGTGCRFVARPSRSRARRNGSRPHTAAPHPQPPRCDSRSGSRELGRRSRSASGPRRRRRTRPRPRPLPPGPARPRRPGHARYRLPRGHPRLDHERDAEKGQPAIVCQRPVRGPRWWPGESPRSGVVQLVLMGAPFAVLASRMR
ncbi:PE-PGRS family protein [Pseudonocardia dioxanivorans CB1190]|uniref:PE-PGRS family protein n=1 Tax=Pseudonocardia dioxanivorans (strain ATCC 55486 / DSM 44775 / JCM 13855 / CB1190) TaxID=675635 RepID=F4CKZ8_PSEUX|nr:PE-PGRS family protein [Pseudonocardia dioxanivorans CB1190]